MRSCSLSHPSTASSELLALLLLLLVLSVMLVMAWVVMGRRRIVVPSLGSDTSTAHRRRDCEAKCHHALALKTKIQPVKTRWCPQTGRRQPRTDRNSRGSGGHAQVMARTSRCVSIQGLHPTSSCRTKREPECCCCCCPLSFSRSFLSTQMGIFRTYYLPSRYPVHIKVSEIVMSQKVSKSLEVIRPCELMKAHMTYHVLLQRVAWCCVLTCEVWGRRRWMPADLTRRRRR